MTKQQDLIDLARRMRVTVFPSDELGGLILGWATELESLATDAAEPRGECICPKCGLRHGSSSADGGF